MLSPVKFDFDGMCGGASQYDHLTLHTIIQAKGGEIVYVHVIVICTSRWRYMQQIKLANKLNYGLY